MIKVNVDKQDDILRHLKDFTTDIGNYLLNTKEEFSFLKESLSQFHQLTSDFKLSLDNFIKIFSSRLEKLVFASKAASRVETKRTYGTLLRFIFTQISTYFADFREKIDSVGLASPESFLQVSSEFSAGPLSELGSQMKILKDEIASAEQLRLQLNEKKTEFFNFVNDAKLEKLYAFRTQRQADDKDFKKLSSLEMGYLKHFVALNNGYSRVHSQFERTMSNYDLNIKLKLQLMNSSLLSSLRSEEDSKYTKFEETLNGFSVSFIDFSASIWLKNVSKLRECFFPYRKLLSYRAKLQEDSLKDVVSHISLINNITPKNVIEQSDLIATVIINDLAVRGQDRHLRDFLIAADSDVLLLVLLKLKLFIKYEHEIIRVSPETMSLLKLLIESGVKSLESDELSDAMMELMNSVFYIATKVFVIDEFDGLLNASDVLVRSSLLFELRNLNLLKNQKFWKCYFEMIYFKLMKREGSSKLRKVKAAEKIMYLHFFFIEDVNSAQSFVESTILDSNINVKLIRSSAILKLATALHGNHRKTPIFDFVFAKQDKVIRVFELTLKLGYATHSRMYLNRYIWRAVKAFTLKKNLMIPDISILSRRKLWSNLSKKVPFSPTPFRKISTSEFEQIKIDVLRTKQAKGPQYQKDLMGVIVEFFECSEETLSYFQGFNYIASFVYDYFDDREQTLRLLNYLERLLIGDFFTDNICMKLNLLHFQLNHIVKDLYPTLHLKWQKSDMNSEALFSSFLISLFTHQCMGSSRFLPEFWDVIFAEKWRGVIKCIIYLIHINLPELVSCEPNETVRFFSESHMDKNFAKRFSAAEFKFHVQNVNLDEELFSMMEKRFRAIRGTISRLESM